MDRPSTIDLKVAKSFAVGSFVHSKCLVFIGCIPQRVAFVVCPMAMVRNDSDAYVVVEADVGWHFVNHVVGILVDGKNMRLSVVCKDNDLCGSLMSVDGKWKI